MSAGFNLATLVPPCPPHQWAHAPTVGYFRCGKCGQQINHDDPEYATIMAVRDSTGRGEHLCTCAAYSEGECFCGLFDQYAPALAKARGEAA